MNTQEFDLNIIPDSAPVIVHVDQYDHGVGRLVASLYDDETPYAPEGASVYVQGTKPDGKFFVRSTGVSISGNVVTADLAEVMTQVAGRTRMQFVVTEPSGRTGTFVFWLDVQLSALPTDSEMSESDISMVEEAIEQMQDLASDAAESAQEAAGFAQNSSDSAEDSEAWAVGTRNGEAVTPGDPTYHNNSKWYAEHGGGAGGGHTIVNSDGQDMPQRNAMQFKGMNVTDDALNDMTIVEGGSGGSTIEVTTAESSLIGKDVTISDGTNTWTAQFDNSGKAVFSGITSTGSLTVSATDGSETAQYILTAPYFGKYAVTLAFWSATINVSTTTTQLNGKTVYAKKNGVVMGSGAFSNGSASITVPEAGSYTLEVTLSWKTYQSSPINVTSETTYSATLNGFIAPISLSTPTSEFYGQDISVTCDGTAVPGTSFDDSGAASFTALQAGTYVFIVMYNGEPYTATVIVTSETSYSAVINMFTATINVTTPSSSLYGQTITIKKDGTAVGTAQFDNTGAASITVHDTGSYVFEATYDGYTFASDPVNVSAETTYSATITAFTATLNISTSSPALYEQTITIKKGTTTVGTTTFSASGTATFNVHETGEYTLECGGYSSSVTVSAETTYSVTISAGLSLSAWISAGSTTEYPLNPSSYANFAALEADEEAIRQLMLVHNAVDYLAQATAGDSLMQSVINSDICAKWINLSDYALDTLYANSNIADEMDTANKYFYGEWGKIDSTTWGALGNVPIMTANNAPYGTAICSTQYGGTDSAYAAFDGNDSSYWSTSQDNITNQYIGYIFPNPVCVKKVHFVSSSVVSRNMKNYKIQASNDGFVNDIHDLTETLVNEYVASNPVDVDLSGNDDYYLGYRIFAIDAYPKTAGQYHYIMLQSLQFYGRELTPLVPTMTADNAPKGTVTASSEYNNSTRAKWRAFNGDKTDGWMPTEANGYNNNYVQYTFTEAMKVTMAKFFLTAGGSSTTVTSSKIYGSTDGSTFSEIGSIDCAYNAEKCVPVTSALYKAVRGSITGKSPSESILSGNGYNFQFFGMDYSEKEFGTGSTRETIYDHGVAPNGIHLIAGSTGGTPVDDGNQITVTSPNSAALSNYSLIQSNEAVNMGDYDYMHVRYGNRFVYVSGNPFHLGAWKTKMTGQNYANSDIDLDIDLHTVIPLTVLEGILDITQVSATEYPAYYASYTRAVVTASIKELWLE